LVLSTILLRDIGDIIVLREKYSSEQTHPLKSMGQSGMKRDERARRGDAYTVASSEANWPPTWVELDKDIAQRRRSSKRHCHGRWLSVVGSRHGWISSPWACWPRAPVMGYAGWG
jgi:hypothetical protein